MFRLIRGTVFTQNLQCSLDNSVLPRNMQKLVQGWCFQHRAHAVSWEGWHKQEAQLTHPWPPKLDLEVTVGNTPSFGLLRNNGPFYLAGFSLYLLAHSNNHNKVLNK